MSCLNSFSLRPQKEVFGILLVLLVLIVTSNEIWIFKSNYQGARRTHYKIYAKFWKDRENWTTSVLGSWLFKYNTTVQPQKRKYVVIVYRDIPLRMDHLKNCSVKNCYFSYKYTLLPKADAILFNLYNGYLPPVRRRPHQRWIFLNEESPIFTFEGATRRRVRGHTDIKQLANVFNWSMSYRTDSDIPYTYGHTEILEEPVFPTFNYSALTTIIPNWDRKRRDVLVTIMMSRCLEFRMNFINTLQKHIPVDVYGSCSKQETLKRSCPGHYKRDCDQISAYLFYLALENSSCREYLTEKIWYSSYMKGAIPIIMGPPLSDCERLLPPNSFIYIPKNHNRTVIEQLAQRIMDLNEDENALLSLHEWRNHFEVKFDHGYFGEKSVQLCRLCEALNYNDKSIKIYNETDIRWYLDSKLLCERIKF